MGVFGWLRRWWRVRRIPHERDPEAALEAMLAHLDEQVAETRGQLVAFQGDADRVQAMLREAQRIAAHQYTHAAQALTIGEDGLAREAMRLHLHAGQQIARYQRQVQQGAVHIGRLRQLVDVLEAHRSELEAQRQQLAMRSYLARARYTLARTLYGEQGRHLLSQAEDALCSEEFTAEAYIALTAPPEDDPPALENALADLRSQLGLLPPSEDG